MPQSAPRPLITPLRVSIAVHALLLAVLVVLVPEPSPPKAKTPLAFRFVGDVDPEPRETPIASLEALHEPVDDLELPPFDVLLPPLTVEEDLLPAEPEDARPRPPPAAIHIPRGATRKRKAADTPPPTPSVPAARPTPRRAPQPRVAVPRVIRRPGTLRGFYPRSAQVRGIEGTALVLVQVDAAGQVVSARVHKSSGNGDLDRAALRVARLYEFAPGSPGRALLPVPFRLRD